MVDELDLEIRMLPPCLEDEGLEVTQPPQHLQPVPVQLPATCVIHYLSWKDKASTLGL